jgi:hypothetical protein
MVIVDQAAPGRPSVWVTLLQAAVLTAIVAAPTWSLNHKLDDYDQYAIIAQGRMSEVIKPFANRVLAANLVHEVTAATGLSTEQGFAVIGLLSLFGIAACTAAVLNSYTKQPAFVFALLLIPWTLDLFREYYLPDLPHAALAAIYFLLLYNGRYWESVALLLLMQLTREATLLLAAVAVVVLIRDGRWKPALASAGAVVAAMAVVGYATRDAQPNLHHINSGLYLVLKVPFNISRNVFGVMLWTDSLGDKELPTVWAMDLPSWLQRGNIHKIEYCGLDPVNPMTTLMSFLTLFGVVPVLVIRELWLRWKRRVSGGVLQPWVKIALAYGLVSFFAGPALGASVRRLVGYGWPAFLLAGALLLAGSYHFNRRAAVGLLIIQVLACWGPLALARSMPGSIPMFAAALGLAVMLNLAAWLLIGQATPEHPAKPDRVFARV